MKKNSGIEYDRELLERVLRKFEEDLIRHSQRNIYQVILAVVERPLIESALERTFGNQSKAAKILGINRNTLYGKIKKLAINIRSYKQYT